jgi:LmbE family N-acetylglucosaminyl deacetylase
MEALAAWSGLGVSGENLISANLAQSPVGGPAAYSDQQLAHATDIFRATIRSLPKNSAVIVPADGESHVDHRAVRRISLQAVLDINRTDLIVYESPEYNGFLSVVQCPKRTIRTLVRNFPGLGRLIGPYVGPANYVSGPPGFVFRDTPKRLAKKRELLTCFISQDADLLLRLFGYETPYRAVSVAESISKPDTKRCLPAFGSCCSPSALMLGLTMIIVTFLTVHEVTRGLTLALSPALPVRECSRLIGIIMAGIYSLRSVRGTVRTETSLFVYAAALGLFLGAI